MITAILTILLFFILIIPHEFGHFIVAKLMGVQVNEFAVGMGPLLFTHQGKETKYSIRAFPLGGYCAMEGENEESDNERAFNNKSPIKKLAILLAGAFMNIITAVILITIMITSIGIPTDKIGIVDKGSPAYEAGIRKNDKISVVNSEKTDNWQDVAKAIEQLKPNEKAKIVIQRSGKERTLSVIPKQKKDRTVIGISPKMSHNIINTLPQGIKATYRVNHELLQGFWKLIKGGVSKDDIAGPVGIVKLVSSSNSISTFCWLAAIISLNLALLNLLPFPALDGGRILFVIIRGITGKMISDKVEGIIHTIGMSILIMLFLVITFNDIVKLF